MDKVMQHTQPSFVQNLIMAIFALALVVIGWPAWTVANADVSHTAMFLGWFGVVACAVNLGWCIWFYAKRWLTPTRPAGGAA